MIRIVTRARIERLEHEARSAREHARQSSGAANEAFGEHVRKVFALTARAERAEADASEVSAILSDAMEELAAAHKELLLKDIAVNRLREELTEARWAGRELFLLRHYGEPHTIYRSRQDAYADTATHGGPADGWGPADERPAREVAWRIEVFIQQGTAGGFPRAVQPAPAPVGGDA